MTTNANCGNCLFWRTPNADLRSFGRCHRFPPILIQNKETDQAERPKAFFGWPTAAPTQSCGEHKPMGDENVGA